MPFVLVATYGRLVGIATQRLQNNACRVLLPRA